MARLTKWKLVSIVMAAAIFLVAAMGCGKGDPARQSASKEIPVRSTRSLQDSTGVQRRASSLLKDMDVLLPFELPSTIGDTQLATFRMTFPEAYANVQGISPWLLKLDYAVSKGEPRLEDTALCILLTQSVPLVSPWDNIVALRQHAQFLPDSLEMQSMWSGNVRVGRLGAVDVMLVLREGTGPSIETVWKSISVGVADAHLDAGSGPPYAALSDPTERDRMKQVASRIEARLRKKDIVFPFRIPETIGWTKLDWYEVRYPREYSRSKGLNPWIVQLRYRSVNGEPALCVYLAREAPASSPTRNVEGLYNNAGFTEPTELVALALRPPKDTALDRLGNTDVLAVAVFGSGAGARQAIDVLQEGLESP